MSDPGRSTQSPVRQTSSQYQGSQSSQNSQLEPVPDILKEAYIPIIDRIWEAEKNFSTVVRKHNKHTFRKVSSHLLASMYPEVVEGLYERNLAKRHAEEDTNLVKIYGPHASTHADSFDVAANTTDWLEQANKKHVPVLYARTLVNNKGDPPTLDKKRRIAQTIVKYAQRDRASRDTIHKIDNVDPKDKPKMSKLLYGENDTIIDSRVQIATNFAEAVTRLSDQPSEVNRAWTYIGYASSANKRLMQHDAGQSSSFLMQLTERVAQVTFPDSNFAMASFVVAFLATPDEFAIGEVLLTSLASAQAKTGKGFAVTQAGLSVKQPDGADWGSYMYFRENSTPYLEVRQLMGQIARAEISRIKLVDEKRQGIAKRDRMRDDIQRDIDWLADKLNKSGEAGLNALTLEGYQTKLRERLKEEQENLAMLRKSVAWSDSLGVNTS